MARAMTWHLPFMYFLMIRLWVLMSFLSWCVAMGPMHGGSRACLCMYLVQVTLEESGLEQFMLAQVTEQGVGNHMPPDHV